LLAFLGNVVQVLERFTATVKNGFAFVELVVLTAIFAVIAGFAVPRFSALNEEARSASVVGLGHEVRLRSSLAHALWLAQGQPHTVELKGRAIGLINGYPDRESIGIAVSRNEDFAYDASTGVFIPREGEIAVLFSCMVAYSVPVQPGQAPQVSIETSGC
jgi:MSHA pilin protein MshA